MSYYDKNIKEDEQIIRLVRFYPLVFFLPILATLSLFLTPFFLLYPLFQMGSSGIIVFSLLLFLGIFALIKIWVFWYFNSVLITNNRVIFFKQKGFFEKEVRDIWYSKIQNVSYQVKGIFATILNYGTIKIESFSDKEESYFIAKYIKNPSEIQNLINQLQYQSSEKKKEKETINEFLSAQEIMQRAPLQELFKVVRRIKEAMGEEKFKKNFLEEDFEEEEFEEENIDDVFFEEEDIEGEI